MEIHSVELIFLYGNVLRQQNHIGAIAFYAPKIRLGAIQIVNISFFEKINILILDTETTVLRRYRFIKGFCLQSGDIDSAQPSAPVAVNPAICRLGPAAGIIPEPRDAAKCGMFCFTAFFFIFCSADCLRLWFCVLRAVGKGTVSRMVTGCESKWQ